MNNQSGEHQKHNNFSHSSLQPSDISFQEIEKSSPSYINNETEIKEIDEVAEFDVETVIKKQETHDLFCPNCNSCITKRVILRKRKRRIPVPSEDSKRNKPETSIPSQVKLISDNDQPQNGGDTSLDDVQTSESTHQIQREPEVFRCLSCFSIFIPTGNGFKLFRMFGSKASEQLDQKNDAPVKKRWFSSIFPSNDTQKLDNQGVVQSSDAGNSVVASTVFEDKPADEFVASSTVCESNGRESEIDRVQQPITRDGNAPSSTHGSDIIKEQRVVEDTDNALNGTSVDTHDQLLTPYHTEPNDKSDYPGMFVVKPPHNSAEPSVSPLEYDGLKLIVPPNVGSLIINNSQMNQELDVTVQTDKQIKLVDDLSNIAGIEGKDTMITIGGTGTHVESGSRLAGGHSVDVVKSVVYGGLMELIVSLSVVSSSAGAGAATLNVLALGLANIFGGLIVIGHDLWDLKDEPTRNEQEDRYRQLLGRRADFPLHVVVSLLSYLVFGFLPLIIYGFSFREKDLKLLTVAAASIVCISALAAGKAYVQRPVKSYFKTMSYYVVLGLMVSGVSYFVGGFIMKLLEKLHVLHSVSVHGSMGVASY